MDNKEIRRMNMLALVEETRTKTLRELAAICNVSETYLSQVKSENIAAQMGDAMARRLESGMRKPLGWMDLPPEAAASADEQQLLHAYRRCTPEAQRAVLVLLTQIARSE